MLTVSPVSLLLPGVLQVNLPAATGEMGILANHVPTVEALRPGIVEVIEEAGGQGKKWFGESS
jgi:F-type H+-transporting ATPase subunit delta